MSDPICDDDYEDKNRTDFVKASGSIISDINYKLGFFMFIIGTFLFSDMFIENVLNSINGSVHGECPTTKGTMIQLLIFCILLIVLDLLIKWQFL